MDRSFRDLIFSTDPEALLRHQYASVITSASSVGNSVCRPGHPLKILLAGYIGALNTGADVRTSEIVRQIHAVLGSQTVELGVVAIKPHVPQDLQGVQVELFQGNPASFIKDACDRYDVVIACEGSLFTSTFSDGLAAMLVTSLSYARAQGKLAVAFGVEVDRMSPAIEEFVREHCRGVSIFTRNEASRRQLIALGLDARSGTDTGWTFTPRPARSASELLYAAGWDGHTEIVALCPVNPFWWPLQCDPKRALLLPLHGGEAPDYYGKYHFHKTTEETQQQFEAYLNAIAQAVHRYSRQRPIFPLVIGMEPLDRTACEALSRRLNTAPPMIAGEHDAHTLISLLQASHRLVSSRFHAILLSMRVGVPSIGIGFDQRISNLLRDAGYDKMVLNASDPLLEDHLVERLEHLAVHGRQMSRGLKQSAADHLKQQAEMGRALRLDIARHYPDFPLPPAPTFWHGYLPPLDGDMSCLADEIEDISDEVETQ